MCEFTGLCVSMPACTHKTNRAAEQSGGRFTTTRHCSQILYEATNTEASRNFTFVDPFQSLEFLLVIYSIDHVLIKVIKEDTVVFCLKRWSNGVYAFGPQTEICC